MSEPELHFIIHNNFGKSHAEALENLSKELLVQSNMLLSHGTHIDSAQFRVSMMEISINYLRPRYPKLRFECFFQKIDSDYYFIVNNIHDHPALRTPHGVFIHDSHLIALNRH